MLFSFPFYHAARGGILLSLVLLLAGGCSGPLEPGQYRAYLADSTHGLSQTQAAGPIMVTCTYRPTDLLVLQEVSQAGGTATTLQLDSLKQSYAGKTYCSLALAKDSAAIENQYATNPTAFAQTLAYLSTGIAADVFLVTSPRDSVAALASMYPRQYDTSRRSTVLLIFDTHQLDLQHGFHIIFRGTAFGVGTLRFPFTAASLAALPALRFS